ncbi:MAG: carbohydrate ABC transporter permease [Candidatus Atribacteria bacterium]|nr:carbohydrate ABC transporter permease [Candidatus Atribacteria bacterium]
MNRIERRLNIFIILIIIILLLVFLSPFIWNFMTSFKDKGEYFTYPPVFIPKSIDFEHYVQAWHLGAGKGIKDSLIIAVFTTLIALVLGSLAAYALARFKIGGENLAFWILSIRMMPPVASILPLFLFFRTLKWLDTYQALILTYSLINVPFVVWMMKGFFEELPHELEEAALVDGCGRLGAFIKIAIPLVTPGLVATALFCFMFSWNEFIFALILGRSRVTPITVNISGLIGGHEILWAEISSASIMASIPIIILAMFLQRYLVRGLTLGAVKG